MAEAKTGWPAPELMQDDHRKLFAWFASRPEARLLVREAAERQALAEALGQMKPNPEPEV